MSKHRKLLLEDEFEFQTVPFIVRVERQTMYIHATEGDIRGVNVYDAPTGMRKTRDKAWTKCECVVARVRPDYPYSIDKEWPENVDKHASNVVPLELPTRNRGLIFSSYEAEHERSIDEIDIQALAERTVEDLKTAYNERDEVQSLDTDV